MSTFDPSQFRQQFPSIKDHDVYLDSAASALKPLALIAATQDYYQHNGSTVHRSQHLAADRSTDLFERTRQQTARLLNAKTCREIIWTRSTTEAINLVAYSYLLPRLRPGDQILVSEAEHHSNLIPWLMIAKQCSAQVVKLPLNAERLPDIANIQHYLTNNTRLLALGQMSNVTGGSPDLAVAIQAAHQIGAMVMIDGAQGIVHAPPDVQDLDIDFYAFSTHKLYGPTGLGVLYAKSDRLAEMQPWQGGGKMLTQVSFDGFTPLPFPHCFEAGTPNVAGVIGFGAVVDWLSTLNHAAAEEYSCQLADLAEQRLATLEGFQSYRVGKSPLLAFNFTGVHHADLADLLAKQGIALRAGQHCAQPLIEALGVTGTLRASFAPYNTPEDLELLFQSTRQALNLLTG